MKTYNPKKEFYKRMSPSAKANLNRRDNHRFSESIGGDASNYQDHRETSGSAEKRPRQINPKPLT